MALAPARRDRRPESQLVIETHFAVDSNESEASFSIVANPPASTFLLTPLLRHNDQLDVFDRSSSVANVTTLSLSHRYPHGTQVTFHCVSGILRDKTTWQIICEEGNWIGRPLACGTNRLLTPQRLGLLTFSLVRHRRGHFSGRHRSAVQQDVQLPQQQAQRGDLLRRPASYGKFGRFPARNRIGGFDDSIRMIGCSIFNNGPGAWLWLQVARCQDIGKFAFVGSVRRRCSRGKWTGMEPQCFGLSQENDYARTLIRDRQFSWVLTGFSV